VDGDGFLYILDRVSRYSKIGGEMVPHLAVEEALARRLGLMEPAVAVSAGEDERRGEQLVLFFRGDVGPAERINAMLGESGLPNLWRPRKDNLVEVDSLPVLGSGKLDLHRLKQMAQEHVRGRPGLLRRAAERIAGAARWTGSDRDAGGAG
jgi:acyl-[acyl-carrier-protein]-phospholipid O-acyltransferase/long-chain-fatty-acid--[acyl-carrier-protein] ligase